ncbi:hypothetical protein ACOMHN_015364 [Nucella lapillus]
MVTDILPTVQNVSSNTLTSAVRQLQWSVMAVVFSPGISFMAPPLHRPGTWALALVFLAVVTSFYDVITVSGAGDDDLQLKLLHKPSKEVDRLNLTDLLGRILGLQFGFTANYTDESPATIAGLFPSEVRVNFEGEDCIAALKDDYKVDDLSSLATLLTLNVLVEASVKAPVEKVPLANLSDGLDSLDTFSSPSFGEDRSALMAFWPVQSQGPPDKWTSRSVNVLDGGQDLNPLLVLHQAVTACKDKCPQTSQALQDIQGDELCLPYFNESLSESAKRYNFPPDVTSSFANLALGVLLQMAGDNASASALEAWKKKNAKMTSLVKHVYQFAYRPLTSESPNNVIDSRLYYVMEKYLSQRSSGFLENAAFVTYWIPQQSPEGRVQYGSGVLPTYNTVDLFATATFLYGLTTAVLHGFLPYDDMANLFEDLYPAWNKTVRRHVTEAILSAIQDGGLDGQGNPLAYVDDILPPRPAAAAVNGDAGKDGDKPPISNDRLFSTASAANSLLAAWTVHNTKTQLLFLPDTPADVALATKGLVNYVISKYSSQGVSMMNVIHSTMYKGCQSLPCYFPANSVVTKNGTSFNGSHPTRDILFGMRGQVSSKQYTAMLQETRYGHQTVSPLPAINSPADPFFFWSSPVYTQATCFLAMGQMKNVEGKVKRIDKLKISFQQN